MKQKILKSISITFLLGLFFASNLFSQQTLTITSSSKSSILRYKNTSGNFEYQYNDTNDIGRENGTNSSNSNSNSDIYRSEHTFQLGGIPSNATISDVKLWYAIAGNSSSSEMYFKITQTSGTKSYGDLWSEISSGGLIIDDIYYFGTTAISSSTLKSKVEAAKSNNVIYIGALSKSEGTDLTDASIELRLIVTYTVPVSTVNLTAKNDMNGYSGGNIGVGVNISATSKPSPHPINDVNVGDNINLQAYENQTNGGYNYIWNDTEAPNEKSEWIKEIGIDSDFISNNQSATYIVASTDNGANLVGYLKKVCNITFSNDFQATSDGGTMEIGGTSYSLPKTSYVVEGNTITATAIYSITIDEITHKFWYWDNNPLDNNRTKTFSVSEHKEHVAHYKPYIQTGNTNLTLNSYNPRVQQNIVLTWNDHPSPGVIHYNVIRQINHNAEDTIATVIKGSATTYTDGDYYLAPFKTNETVKYCIGMQFAPYDTVSNTNFVYTDGEYAGISKIAQTDSTTNESPKIEKYALNSNYPNPFNPTTQISYQLPENSFVSLIVYNTLGQEVATLVNQYQSSGQYTVQFNASTSSATAANLPSGVYIYKLQAGNYSNTKKMLLTK